MIHSNRSMQPVLQYMRCKLLAIRTVVNFNLAVTATVHQQQTRNAMQQSRDMIVKSKMWQRSRSKY